MTESERQTMNSSMYLTRLIKEDIWYSVFLLLLNNLIENIVRVHRHIMQIKEELQRKKNWNCIW